MDNQQKKQTKRKATLLGILSIFDLTGCSTFQQMQDLLPEPPKSTPRQATAQANQILRKALKG